MQEWMDQQFAMDKRAVRPILQTADHQQIKLVAISSTVGLQEATITRIMDPIDPRAALENPEGFFLAMRIAFLAGSVRRAHEMVALRLDLPCAQRTLRLDAVRQSWVVAPLEIPVSDKPRMVRIADGCTPRRATHGHRRIRQPQ